MRSLVFAAFILVWIAMRRWALTCLSDRGHTFFLPYQHLVKSFCERRQGASGHWENELIHLWFFYEFCETTLSGLFILVQQWLVHRTKGGCPMPNLIAKDRPGRKTSCEIPVAVLMFTIVFAVAPMFIGSMIDEATRPFRNDGVAVDFTADPWKAAEVAVSQENTAKAIAAVSTLLGLAGYVAMSRWLLPRVDLSPKGRFCTGCLGAAGFVLQLAMIPIPRISHMFVAPFFSLFFCLAFLIYSLLELLVARRKSPGHASQTDTLAELKDLLGRAQGLDEANRSSLAEQFLHHIAETQSPWDRVPRANQDSAS
jgi:hypothetical protein